MVRDRTGMAGGLVPPAPGRHLAGPVNRGCSPFRRPGRLTVSAYRIEDEFLRLRVQCAPVAKGEKLIRTRGSRLKAGCSPDWPMSHSFPRGGNAAEVVGQVVNLRRVGNPPAALVKRPSSAGWQPARRMPSCPTTNADSPPVGKLCGIGQNCLPHFTAWPECRADFSLRRTSVRLARAAEKPPAGGLKKSAAG